MPSRRLMSKARRSGVEARLGDLAEAAQLQELVEAARADVLGAQHPDTIRCRVNLLLTQAELGIPGAAADREQAVAELTALLGPDYPDARAAVEREWLLCVIDPQPF